MAVMGDGDVGGGERGGATVVTEEADGNEGTGGEGGEDVSDTGGGRQREG